MDENRLQLGEMHDIPVAVSSANDHNLFNADGQQLVIRACAFTELIDLRHVVLRTGLPRKEAIFPRDELPTSYHFGAFMENRAVCCATFHLEEYEHEPALRLRGMATDAQFRGKGVGHALMEFAERVLIDTQPIRLLFCNARLPAVRFYQSMGWKIVSDVFDIPTAGPHYRMIKQLRIDQTALRSPNVLGQ